MSFLHNGTVRTMKRATVYTNPPMINHKMKFRNDNHWTLDKAPHIRKNQEAFSPFSCF